MREKLNNARGETLVEVLACVLICALSITLLVGAVTVSANIDGRAQKTDGEYYAALSRAEAQNEAEHLETLFGRDVSSGLKITVENLGTDPNRRGVTVYFYGSEKLFSFAPIPGGGS